MGTIQIDGSTPKLTIGNATAEDATILFDGNAQDFYIALDDSADDLLIGLGSTVGTTPAIAIDENLKVNIPVTTASTSASTGSLTTGGGAGIGADLYVGDDVYLITDSAVLGFGADKDTTLTHTDGTGLTLNSTNKLCFNDASQYIQGASNAILDIAATDEIELNATLVDINANVEISGTATTTGVHTFSATPVFPDGSLALADLDIDGGTDIGADIVDADLLIIDDGAGGTNRKTAASRLKTYIGGGISEVDMWVLSANFTGDALPITSNIERADFTGFEETQMGTGMTFSSGVFTFPSTGYWLVNSIMGFSLAGDTAYVNNEIDVTINNSNYYAVVRGHSFIDQSQSSTTYTSQNSSLIVDVTNTTNVKVRFGTQASNTSTTTIGNNGTGAAINETRFIFIRLGDT
jgi:hypothetical protein